MRKLFFGFYGLGSSYGLNIEPALDDIQAGGFGGLEVHGLGSIWQNGKMPWKLKANGKYDLDQDDEEYYTAYEAMCAGLKKRHMRLYDCFFDQYFTDKSAQYQHHPHPFRSNVNGFNFGPDVRLLYNNYNYQTKQNTWIKIPAASENDPTTFTPIIKGITHYVDRKLAIVADTDVKFYTRLFNEEFCMVGADGHCTAQSAGDASMLDDWLEMKIHDAGVDLYVVMNDFTPFASNNQIAWPNFKDAALYTIRNKRIQEVHHSSDALMAQIKAQGLNTKRFFRSTDGVKELDAVFYPEAKATKAAVANHSVFAADIKFFAGEGYAWSEDDIQKDFSDRFKVLVAKI